MKSRAAICVGPNRPLEIDMIDVSGPGEGEILIEVKASGLCHSDYHQMDGSIQAFPYPIILGHEGAGIVADIGAGVTALKPGDHVLPTSMPECRQCAACTSGKTNMCDEFFKLFGAASPFSRNGQSVAQFAGCGTLSNYTVVKEISVAKIRGDAPFETACIISCCVITGVGSAIKSAKVEVGSTVIVFGLGGVGLNVLQGARLAGAGRIIGVDINPARETFARQMGATHFINSRTIGEDLVTYLNNLTGGGADYTFECVGNTALMQQAIETARPGFGVAMVIGGAPTGSTLSISPGTVLMGRTFKGAVLGDTKGRTGVPKFVDLYMNGQIKVDELVTHRFPLERVNDGFAKMISGEAVRSVVVF